MFSFCELQGDKNAIEKIINKLEKNILNNVTVMEYKGQINELLKVFSSMEIVVGCRFHSIILSLLFNQGVYPIIYSDKTYNVLKDLHLDQHLTFIKDIEQLDVKEVLNSIQTNKLNDHRIFKEAQKQFKILDKYILQ